MAPQSKQKLHNMKFVLRGIGRRMTMASMRTKVATSTSIPWRNVLSAENAPEPTRRDFKGAVRNTPRIRGHWFNNSGTDAAAERLVLANAGCRDGDRRGAATIRVGQPRVRRKAQKGPLFSSDL